jgi:hypothetical protein
VAGDRYRLGMTMRDERNTIMTKHPIPMVIGLGLALGALAALLILGMAPTMQAKRAVIDAAGPYALAATGIALLAYVAMPRSSGRRHR